MHDIFDGTVCLIDPLSDWIPLFKRSQDFEIFQLRLGLKNLCQNTIIFPIGRNFYNELCYRELISPHAEEFYNDRCRQFRLSSEDAPRQCQRIQQRIVSFFCENASRDILNEFEYKLLEYNDKNSKECYIRYKCPYVNLYKFGFPIYVNNVVIAVLFVGQFSLQTHSKNIISDNLWKRITQKEDEISEQYDVHCFRNEDALMHFVNSNIICLINEFTHRARMNLIEYQIDQLKRIIKNSVANLEEDIMTFLLHMDEILPNEEHETSMQSRFWMIVQKNINSYLKQIGADSVSIFIKEHSEIKRKNYLVHGYKICPKLDLLGGDIFDFGQAQIASQTDAETLTTFDQLDGLSNDFFYNCITSPDRGIYNNHNDIDILVHFEKLQPFAILIKYTEESKVKGNGQLRKSVLYQLEHYFSKVGQELAHFSIRLSEHTTKTVLRIYRHEIMHQCLVLDHNNWFLDLERLKKVEDNKLRLVSEDQRQCIFELDFMTQNINVVTGQINKQVVDLDKDIPIDINSTIINKAISLHQRKKCEKVLWFSVQNNSSKECIKSNLELLDLIFFNLMSNAIKYSYSGTNIIIGIRDTNNHARPHTISLTDFGINVNAKSQEQVFQMYFRGNEDTCIEGSGIGLYVAHTVSEILGAKIYWKSTQVSKYNIPMMMRYLKLPPNLQKREEIDITSLYEEYARLNNGLQLNRIFNQEYLHHPGSWNINEILGEIRRPTYEVVFSIEL